MAYSPAHSLSFTHSLPPLTHSPLLTHSFTPPHSPELSKHPVDGFSAGLADENNVYEWDIMIIGPPETLYDGGFFKARMNFPKAYPQMPPKLHFISEMWHPNGTGNARSLIVAQPLTTNCSVSGWDRLHFHSA